MSAVLDGALDTPGGVVVTEAEPGSDDWFHARRGGITGTDLPKILGITRYGNALSVWLDKRGELDDDAGEAARWGTILEEPVAAEWAHRTGATVHTIGVVRNVDEPWLRASLDRTVEHLTCPDGGFDCGLEVKTRNAFKADEWRDGIPDDVLAQTTWGLLTTDLDHMHVAALIGGQRLQTYRVDRNQVLEDYLIEQARPVWQAVEDGTPPDVAPDADGVLLDLLDRLYVRREGARDLDAQEVAGWRRCYETGHRIETRGKGLKTKAKTALVQLLDDGDTGLVDDTVAFTYRAPEPGHAMPADQVRRLKKDSPRRFAALVRDGFITATNPSPRFDLKKVSNG